jgi:hypothetical protein
MIKKLLLSAALSPLFLSTTLAAIDTFDTPPYVTGDVIGQAGDPSVWAPGTWATQSSPQISGTILPAGQLQIAQTVASPFQRTASIGRQYSTVGLPSSYTISFDLTLTNIDSIRAGGFNNDFTPSNNAGDYLNIFGRDNTAANSPDFAGDGTWLVRGGQLNATGKSISNGSVSPDTNQNDYDATAPLDWYAFNYTPLTGHSVSDVDVVDTGIALTAGATYHFTISILGGGQWNLRISDGTNTFDSSLAGGPYGFRSAAATPSGNMYFGYSDIGSNADTLPGLVTMNLDNVEVIPEPSVVLLGGAGLLMLLVFRRRAA